MIFSSVLAAAWGRRSLVTLLWLATCLLGHTGQCQYHIRVQEFPNLQDIDIHIFLECIYWEFGKVKVEGTSGQILCTRL